MAFTKYQYFLVLLLVVTGSINTLTTKWADRLQSVDSSGTLRTFNHPFLQACAMFLGELLCLLTFKALYYYYSRKQDGSVQEIGILKGNQNFNPILLLPPALCDMCATSLMYIGLTLTYASSFQMLRGAVIIFVGIFSRIFLRRKLKVREWIGILFVIVGLVVVGLSDANMQKTEKVTDLKSINSSKPITSSEINRNLNVSETKSNTSYIFLGDALVVGAQAIAATQMVWEEKFVSGLDIPALQAVGWEGVFGFVTLGCLQVPFYYIHVPPTFSNNSRGVLEDVPDAFVQMKNEKLIILALIGTILSIAFFNFAGVSVTKEISATTRMVLDSVRTFVIWMCTLGLRWQPFHWLQVVGFAILLLGMCVYNNILISNITDSLCCQRRSEADEERLVENSEEVPPESQ